MRTFLLCVPLLAVLFASCATPPASGDPAWGPLVVADDFSGGPQRWEPTDPKAWQVVSTEAGPAYNLHGKSAFKPPFRSPFNISLLRNPEVEDFTLLVRAKSTAREYGHRDLCFFFGYQDPGHFYYAHLGKKTDDHANQIFIVDGKARTKISTRTTAGTPWDDGWHQIKIVRNTASGEILVYFDDMEKPIMLARDRTFRHGRVGLGSFDDTGLFTDFHLYGRQR